MNLNNYAKKSLSSEILGYTTLVPLLNDLNKIKATPNPTLHVFDTYKQSL